MSNKSLHKQLILASTSPYRKILLERLGQPFNCMPPQMDETPLPAETAADLTARLARGKAESIARQHPASIVIGCDQVAEFADNILGKPGNIEAGVKQLMMFSGNTVVFHSAVCLLRLEPHFFEERTVLTAVHFRRFSEEEARRYIELDKPLDCAGSFKSESAGSVLLTALESSDPSALIGLPLIALSEMLRKAGISLP